MEAIPVRTVYRGPLALGRGGPMVRNGRTSTGWASEDHDDDAARRQSVRQRAAERWCAR